MYLFTCRRKSAHICISLRVSRYLCKVTISNIKMSKEQTRVRRKDDGNLAGTLCTALRIIPYLLLLSSSAWKTSQLFKPRISFPENAQNFNTHKLWDKDQGFGTASPSALHTAAPHHILIIWIMRTLPREKLSLYHCILHWIDLHLVVFRVSSTT